MSTASRIPLPCLCMVTDRTRTVSGDLVETVSAAVDAGVGMVQLREKDMPAGQMLELAHNLRAVTKGKSLMIVNDRVDVALLSNADGIQLGEEAMGVAEARKLDRAGPSDRQLGTQRGGRGLRRVERGRLPGAWRHLRHDDSPRSANRRSRADRGSHTSRPDPRTRHRRNHAVQHRGCNPGGSGRRGGHHRYLDGPRPGRRRCQLVPSHNRQSPQLIRPPRACTIWQVPKGSSHDCQDRSEGQVTIPERLMDMLEVKPGDTWR